jgi:hypothetical protein
MKKILILSLISLISIGFVSAETINESDQKVKNYMVEIRTSLFEQKNSKATFLGVISSKKGTQTVNNINKEGKEVIVVATSKDSFCMMKKMSTGEYYCIDNNGLDGNFTGCSKTNISCNPAPVAVAINLGIKIEANNNGVFNREKVIEMIKRLIQEKTLSKAKNNNLLEAVRNNELDKVKQAIKEGADVNIEDYYQGTPLMIAAGTNDIEIVRELIKAGADVNKKIQFGTALSVAAINRNIEAVKELIKVGVNVNESGFYGEIEVDSLPLYIATVFDDEEMINELKGAGAVLSEADEKKMLYGEKDAQIKASMYKMRSAAELSKIKNNLINYTDVAVGVDTEVMDLITAVNDIYPSAPDAVTRTPTTFAKWCYSTVLPSGSNWCVDSNGYVGVPTTTDTCSTIYSCK